MCRVGAIKLSTVRNSENAATILHGIKISHKKIYKKAQFA